MPVEITYIGTNAQLSLYPQTPWGWSTVTATAYSGSTSANGASTHSTMSYYVQPLPIGQNVAFSKVLLMGSFNTGAAGTGSATVRNYFGLYKVSSDSLTQVSSWLGAFRISQNSITAYSMSVVTGSALAGSIASGGDNVSASFTGPKVFAVAQGNSSVLAAGNYYGVYAMHSQSVGANPFAASLAVQANTYNEMGYRTDQTGAFGPLCGVFSSTSSTNAANSNQWLMPPSFATNAITATRSQDELRIPVIFRGI